MLSQLQHFCLDAMGLSHGLAPKIQAAPAAVMPKKVQAQPQQAPPQERSQNNAPQSIKRVMPKIDVPDTVNKQLAPQHKGKPPQEIDGLDDWSTLQTAVKNCQYCQQLANTRSQAIFGSGNEQAELLIISEAPSSDEDLSGHPFVGKAGELLDNMLQAIGIKRENTFITNIIKCQPPNNRDPHKDEAEACSAFLNAQINHIKPTLILALGRIAAHQLLQIKTPVGQLRGTLHQHSNSKTDIIVSYHPAYLLRNPAQKEKSWTDLKMVHQHLKL